MRSNWIQRNLTHTNVWDAFTSLSGKLLTLRKCLAWFAKSTTNPRKTWCAKCPRLHQRYRKRKQGEEENSVEVGNSVAVEVGYLPSRRGVIFAAAYCTVEGPGARHGFALRIRIKSGRPAEVHRGSSEKFASRLSGRRGRGRSRCFGAICRCRPSSAKKACYRQLSSLVSSILWLIHFP